MKFVGDEFELSLFVVFPFLIRRITVVNSSCFDKLLVGC